MGELTLDAVDIVNPDLYVQRGYPHAEWALLRREAPIYYYQRPNVDPFWAVTRHADIVNISRQPALFKSIQRLFVAVNEPNSPPFSPRIWMNSIWSGWPA